MRIFDRIDPDKLDQRDAELWFLALAMLLVLAGGVALLIYPSTFSNPVTLSGVSVRKIFFSFCVLCILLVGYLMERQLMIRQLRKQLNEERTRTSRLLSQAGADLLESLPKYEQFQNQLALDFSRSVTFQQPLSLVVVCLKASRPMADAGETYATYVDAVTAMIRKLRGDDSIYLFGPGVFCILLPGAFEDDASRVSGRLSEGLTDAAGASKRFSFDLRGVNYPAHAQTAREMEEAIHSYVAEARSERQPA